MIIRAGYRITFSCLTPMPILLKLSVHPDRRGDLITNDILHTRADAMVSQHTDPFGNLVTRVGAPVGEIAFASSFEIRDSGAPDRQVPDARQFPVGTLPDDVLPYLLGSRYCETDRLSELAWRLFGGVAPGWGRVQAIVDYVHDRIAFG
jgi:transglutaminase-like putative cysteine protease